MLKSPKHTVTACPPLSLDPYPVFVMRRTKSAISLACCCTVGTFSLSSLASGVLSCMSLSDGAVCTVKQCTVFPPPTSISAYRQARATKR
jgi:hypothetical protein